MASAQDWDHCKPDGSYSFAEVKGAVCRVTTNHAIEGWDVKIFNRSGDMVTIAIVQTLDDKEMTSPQMLEEVLLILREAFACSVRCITSSAERQPRVAALLLEHLHNNTVGEMRSSVDETREFVMRQGRPSD